MVTCKLTALILVVCVLGLSFWLAARPVSNDGVEETVADLPAGSVPVADLPAEVTPSQQRELERLATLGYIDGRGPAPEESGVLHHDEAAASKGATLLTYAKGPEAVLLAMDGSVLHSWSRPGTDYWARVHVYPNGDLLAITCDLYRLIKIDAESSLLWTLELQAHHDFEVQPDGTVWVLVRAPATRARIHAGAWLLDDVLVHVSPDGVELERVSLLEAFERTPEYRALVEEANLPDGPDIFHTNSIEIAGAGRALVSIRALNAIAMVDLSAGTIDWVRTGEWRLQHEAQLLDDHLLLFDNSGLGEQSRVLEVELSSGDVVWSYTAPGFFTRGAGAQQRLAGGNTLITESERGRIIEVDPSGRIVWEYVNPRTVPGRPETILGIMRAERLPRDFPLEWATGAALEDA